MAAAAKAGLVGRALNPMTTDFALKCGGYRATNVINYAFVDIQANFASNITGFETGEFRHTYFSPQCRNSITFKPPLPPQALEFLPLGPYILGACAQ